MAHRKNNGGPVPPGNKSKMGPVGKTGQTAKKAKQSAAEVTSAQEQDPKQRLGDFTGKGEHSMQEPGGHNDANH